LTKVFVLSDMPYKKLPYLAFTFLSILVVAGCGVLFPGYDKPIPKIGGKPLAYYIPDQREIYNPKKIIKVRGELNQLVTVLSEMIQTKTGVNNAILRISDEEAKLSRSRELLRIVTEPIHVDSLINMKKNFMIGYYLMEDPTYIVEPGKMEYRIEASISMNGMDIIIEYQLLGKMEWNLFEMTKKGKKKKKSGKQKAEMGIGIYESAIEEITTNSRGKKIKNVVINKVEVKDQPVSNGNGEDNLYNLTIDTLSMKNIRALIIGG